MLQVKILILKLIKCKLAKIKLMSILSKLEILSN